MDDSSPPSRPIPVREDCWSQEATSTLVDAWGRRYMELNRGNLRQKDWQEVADAVNARHGHSKKTFRTDVQCKNRIDTIKKKYKTEKARVTASNGVLVSNWPFFDRLDALIGPNVKKLTTAGGGQVGMSRSAPLALPSTAYRKSNHTPPLVTVTPVILPKKRAAPADDSYFRRNYSAVAAAAAAAEVEEQDDDEERTEEDEDSERSKSSGERDEDGHGDEDGDGIKNLARAIKRFGEIYARVEGEKQRQMVELEKQRMQFTKELEVQRMQMFMNTQVQLEKIKRSKGSGSNDVYS